MDSLKFMMKVSAIPNECNNYYLMVLNVYVRTKDSFIFMIFWVYSLFDKCLFASIVKDYLPVFAIITNDYTKTIIRQYINPNITNRHKMLQVQYVQYLPHISLK